MIKLFSSFVDPAIPLDQATTKEIHRAAWERWQSTPVNMALLMAAILVPLMLDDLLFSFIENLFRTSRLNSYLISFLIYVPYLFGITWLFRHLRYAPCVFAELRDRGYEVCTKCGYWLRDLDQSIAQCPECGRPSDAMPPHRTR